MDRRAYVAKYQGGVPITIAVTGSDMGDSHCRLSPVEVWSRQDRRMSFAEVRLSRDKMQRIMEMVTSSRSTFHGPDMFHLVDADGTLRMNVWQSVLGKALYVYIYNGDETVKTSHRVEIVDDAGNVDDARLLSEIKGIWDRESGARWTATVTGTGPARFSVCT